MKQAELRHEAIAASAGSGKTFQLAHRYIGLMAQGVAPDRICALTFSRKAAGEIFDTIALHLCAAAVKPESAEQTAKRIGCPGFEPSDFLRLLQSFVQNLHRLHIGTLDSFLVGVARAFPAEIGIPADFQVVDEGGAAAEEVHRQVLTMLFAHSQVDRKAQREFLEAFKLATFGIQEKAFDAVIDRFVRDCREAIQLLPEGACWGEPFVIWPASVERPVPVVDPTAAAEQLRAALPARGLPNTMLRSLLKFVEFAATYEETARWDDSLDGNRVFLQLLEANTQGAHDAMTLRYRGKEHDFDRHETCALLGLLRRVLEVETRRALRQTQGIYRVMARYEEQYAAIVRRSGRLTFRDIQYLLTDANPANASAVLSRLPGEADRMYIDYRLDAKLDHWLLDEFQDTSDLQWAGLRNLADEILQDTTGQRSFFYVGDTKQAIYGWRGGNARLFNRILEEYGPAIHRRPLSKSFRSAPPIIETVNRVFGALPADRLPAGAIALWQQAWQPHTVQHGFVPETGYAAILEPPCAPNMPKPGPEDRRRLLVALLDLIRPIRKGLSTAVLVRSNEEGRRVVEILRATCPELPVALEGKAGIMDNPVVSLLLALIQFAAHPGDMLARRHLQMSALNEALRAGSPDPAQQAEALLRQIHDGGFRTFVRTWGRHLNERARLDPFGRSRWNDLIDAAGEFDASGSTDCSAFLRFVESYEKHELAVPGAVRVMTIHQSKGLGFDVVILPELMGQAVNSGGALGLAMGRDPRNDNPAWALRMPRRVLAQQDRVLARLVERADVNACFDALCVLYVAMTRARRALYMISSFPGPNSKALSPAAFLKMQLLGEPNPKDGPRVRLAETEAVCLFETGTREWFAELPPVSTTPAGREGQPSFAPDFAARPSRRRRIVRIEPSSEEAIVRKAAWLFDPEMRDVLDFGQAIHALFQRVTWIEELEVEQIVRDWRAQANTSPLVARDACTQFRQALQSAQIQAALQRPKADVTLWREKRFESIVRGRLLSGIFDRVVIEHNKDGAPVRATILDYKSDRIEGAREMRSSAQTYRPQLELYAEALSQALRVPVAQIALRLVYTRAGSVLELGSAG